MDAWISANKRAVLPDVRSSSSLQTEMFLPAPSRGIGGRESGCQDCNGVSGSVVRSAKWGLPGDDEMGTAAATEADEEPIKEKSPPPFLATLQSSCCPRCCCCSCRRCHSGSTRASAAFAARSISLDLRSRFSTQYRVIRSSETHDATSSSILPSCPSHPGGGAVLRAADGLPVDGLFGGDGGDDVFLSLLSSMSTALLSVETKEAADVSHSIMTASESDAGAIRKVSPSRIAVTAANLAAVAADEAAEAEAAAAKAAEEAGKAAAQAAEKEEEAEIAAKRAARTRMNTAQVRERAAAGGLFIQHTIHTFVTPYATVGEEGAWGRLSARTPRHPQEERVLSCPQ